MLRHDRWKRRFIILPSPQKGLLGGKNFDFFPWIFGFRTKNFFGKGRGSIRTRGPIRTSFYNVKYFWIFFYFLTLHSFDNFEKFFSISSLWSRQRPPVHSESFCMASVDTPDTKNYCQTRSSAGVTSILVCETPRRAKWQGNARKRCRTRYYELERQYGIRH